MKRLLMLAVLSVVLTVFAVAALAADEAKTAATGTPALSTPAAKTPAAGTPAAKPTVGAPKTGVVKSVDVAAKKVVVMVTRELTFTVTDATQIVQADLPKKLQDIKVDGKVTVDYTIDGQNRIATKIQILDDKPAK
jgi:hypothetical protein